MPAAFGLLLGAVGPEATLILPYWMFNFGRLLQPNSILEFRMLDTPSLAIFTASVTCLSRGVLWDDRILNPQSSVGASLLSVSRRQSLVDLFQGHLLSSF